MRIKNLSKLGRSVVSGTRTILSYSFARETCVCCGRTAVGMSVCRGCLGQRLMKFETDMSKRCTVCGKELISEQKICTRCRAERIFSNASQVFPVFSYRLWMKKLIFDWKMGNRRPLSPVFAEIYRRGLETMGLDPLNCILVPVPPRPGKIKSRGWDQIAEVCDILSDCYGFTVLKLLARFSVEQQKKKDRTQRLDMVGKSYGAVDNWGKILEDSKCVDKTFVVVDDVITTGATVDSCSGILKKMGLEDVRIISLVIVD